MIIPEIGHIGYRNKTMNKKHLYMCMYKPMVKCCEYDFTIHKSAVDIQADGRTPGVSYTSDGLQYRLNLLNDPMGLTTTYVYDNIWE